MNKNNNVSLSINNKIMIIIDNNGTLTLKNGHVKYSYITFRSEIFVHTPEFCQSSRHFFIIG